MKVLRSILLLFFLPLTLVAQEEKVCFQEIYYTIDADKLTAEVATNAKASGALFLPKEITVNEVTYRVTSISNNAFKGCKNLTAIVLPHSIDRIYRSAFEGTGIMLNKENWRDGALYMDSCLIATDKTIDPKYAIVEGTRLIAAGAFRDNKVVTRVEIPTSITRIDHETFLGCKNLQRVNIPSSVQSIGEDAFKGSGIYLNEKKWRKGALYRQLPNCSQRQRTCYILLPE